MTQQEFIAMIYPDALKISQKTGLSWELILAQAAQETGWGSHVLEGTNNFFNIKASNDWTGETKTFLVQEYINGKSVWVYDKFRVYSSIEDSLNDRVKFLADNPRYVKAGLFDINVLGNLALEAKVLQDAMIIYLFFL